MTTAKSVISKKIKKLKTAERSVQTYTLADILRQLPVMFGGEGRYVPIAPDLRDDVVNQLEDYYILLTTLEAEEDAESD